MTVKLGVIMDPIEAIHFEKDSTLALLLAAQARGWSLHYMEQSDLYLAEGIPRARLRDLEVFDDPQKWHRYGDEHDQPLSTLDVILMRKDPPVDNAYLFTTYLLDLAEQQGVFVMNKPQSLRDANEKIAATWFPDLCPKTLISYDKTQLREFAKTHQDVILKPITEMGGNAVFRVQQGDPNLNVVIETLTQNGTKAAIAQQFIPAISEGDKRVLVIDGEPVSYALARIPAADDNRGNLAAGGRGVGVEITETDRAICQRLSPLLKQKGLYFVGIDIIGDRLIEINVTCPTCIRQIDAAFSVNIGAQVMDCVELYLAPSLRGV